MSNITRCLFVATGSVTLLSVRFLVATGFTQHATNYWTMTVRRRKPGQAAGELVGTYTTSNRTLVAGAPGAMLYEDAQGLALGDGDSLWGSQVSTGSPVPLDGPAFQYTVDQETR